VGIEPRAEAKISFIGTAIAKGDYLERQDSSSILIGQALLDKFETRIGRKLVLMSQDKEQEIASRAFRIAGVFRAEMESTEKQFVFVSLAAGQKMLKLGHGISEIAVLLPDGYGNRDAHKKLKAALPADQFEVHNWRELLPFQTA
jgi:ABC-type lipoprotein release transport system permease subunit